MPQPYPDPSFNTTTGLFEHVNNITEGTGVVLIPIAAALVIIITMKTKFYRTSDSLLVGFFIGFFLSIFLWASHLLAGKIVVIFLLFTIISLMYSDFDSE